MTTPQRGLHTVVVPNNWSQMTLIEREAWAATVQAALVAAERE